MVNNKIIVIPITLALHGCGFPWVAPENQTDFAAIYKIETDSARQYCSDLMGYSATACIEPIGWQTWKMTVPKNEIPENAVSTLGHECGHAFGYIHQ